MKPYQDITIDWQLKPYETNATIDPLVPRPTQTQEYILRLGNSIEEMKNVTEGISVN